MKRVLAVSALAWAAVTGPQSNAAEGRMADIAATLLAQSRTSVYRGAPLGKDAAAAAASESAASASKQHAGRAAGKIGGKTLRSATVSPSVRAAHFFIHDAGSRLITDRDQDAYHSEFRIRFDADADFGDALVYAKLYLRRVGDSDWWLYHTTGDFWIFGQSGDDDYFVTTTLEEGFPTSEYDVLIDLHEAGFDGIAATIGPQDSGALNLLPLEEAGLDVPAQLPGYRIGEVGTTLLVDADRDGHYSKFRISFDPDADFDGSLVFVKVWVRAPGGEWIAEHVSDEFLVDAGGAADAYSLTADWISGYATSFYDVQIDMHDAASGLLVASAGSERPQLSRIPLEDQSRDRFDNPPTTGGGGSATSRERGGGALGAWWALALLLLRAVPAVRPQS